MESQHESTPPVEEPDAATTQTADAGEPAPPAGNEERLIDRINDYRRESANQEFALVACMEGLIGGLMDISCRYQQGISTLLAGGHSVLQEHAPLTKAVGTLLGLSRQIDRYVNLTHRLKDKSPKRKSGGSTGPLDGTVPYRHPEFENTLSEEMNF